MPQKHAWRHKQIVAVGAAAGLALTIALLCLGPAGAEVATIVAAYIAWLGVLVTWFPLQPQQQPDSRSPNRLPTAPSPESGITHRRVPISRALKLRITAIAVVIALVALAIFLGISAPLSSSKTFSVAGDVTLLQEDKWLNHQHVLVFQLPDGQYGYLARPDARWWLPWPTTSVAPDWPGFTGAAVFASYYSGLEFLGFQGGNVTFAYRDNYLRWHSPVAIQIGNLPLASSSTSLGFMQYTSLADDQPHFLALMPEPHGGVALYERIEKPPWNWIGPVGVIGASLDASPAVTSAELADGSLCVIVRAGSHLYEMTHLPAGLPGSIGSGWTAPTEVRSGNSAVTVSGNPQLVATTALAQGTTEMILAVPIRGGALLLTTAQLGSSWNEEQLPIHHDVDAVTVLPGSVNGRANLDLTYREGSHLLFIWRWNGGPWHAPSLVQAGN